MAKLGADAEMFGCVGDDNNRSQMIDNLKSFKNIPTGLAVISIGEGEGLGVSGLMGAGRT